MRGGRVAIATVAVLLLGIVFAGTAVACSCASGDPAERLAEADAAVVGRLLRVETTGVERFGVPEARFDYRILRVYRGGTGLRGGRILSLHSPLSGAACGLPQGVGRHYGLFLARYPGRWLSGLCGVILPRELWSAARGPDEGEPAGSSALNCAS